MFGRMMCVLLTFGLAGCSPNMNVKPVQFGETKGAVSGANLRLVTERSRGQGYPKVVCTEPSPDYAVAFDQTRQLTITPPAGSADSKIEINGSSLEHLVEGKGREAAVLALRDGLYTACQSYANGVIGQDAYAIILSQYGNLLVALIGKGSANGGSPPTPAQTAFSALVVACISSQDRSRSRYGENILLNPAFCSSVLARARDRAS